MTKTAMYIVAVYSRGRRNGCQDNAILNIYSYI